MVRCQWDVVSKIGVARQRFIELQIANKNFFTLRKFSLILLTYYGTLAFIETERSFLMSSGVLTSKELQAQLENPRGIDQLSYHQAATEGASYALAETVRNEMDISKGTLSNLAGITPKTLKEREKKNLLKPSEVDRLLRVFRVILAARDTLGSSEDMQSWLKREQMFLGGEIPLDLLQTESGTEIVITALERIKYSSIL